MHRPCNGCRLQAYTVAADVLAFGHLLHEMITATELTEQVRQQYVQHVLDLVFHGVLARPRAV